MPDEVDLSCGTIAEVEIRVEGVKDLFGVDLGAQFDDKVAQITDVSPRGMPDTERGSWAWAAEGGLLRYGAELDPGEEAQSGNGVIARVVVEGIAAGTSSFRMESDGNRFMDSGTHELCDAGINGHGIVDVGAHEHSSTVAHASDAPDDNGDPVANGGPAGGAGSAPARRSALGPTHRRTTSTRCSTTSWTTGRRSRSCRTRAFVWQERCGR